MRIRNSLLLSLAALLVFSSCRKGKEDPLFSLHTRKARVAGDWTIVSYDENQSTVYSYLNGSNSTEQFNRNFGTINYQETTVSNAKPSVTYSGKISRSEFHFTKSGNWNSILEYYLYIPQAVGGYYIAKTRQEEDGTWEFNSKSGDLKNKESMDLVTKNSNHFYYTYSTYLGTVTDSVADSTYSTLEKVATWKLIGLSNTRIKAEINAEFSYVSAVAGSIGTNVSTTSVTSIEMKQ
jgi:hypothetical protein